MTQGNDDDDEFSGFSPDWRARIAVFRDLGAYGKETCKMSENKVVHHNRHWTKPLRGTRGAEVC